MLTGKGTGIASDATLDNVVRGIDGGAIPTGGNLCDTDVTGVGNVFGAITFAAASTAPTRADPIATDLACVGDVLGAIAPDAAATHDAGQDLAAGAPGGDEERIFDPR